MFSYFVRLLKRKILGKYFQRPPLKILVQRRPVLMLLPTFLERAKNARFSVPMRPCTEEKILVATK